MEILEFYKHVIKAAGLDVSDDNIVMANIDGVDSPVEIGGKLLRLPTDDFLKKPDWDAYVAFHPLCENSARGESEVLKVLRRFMVSTLNADLMFMMESLVGIAADKDNHRRLSATASECLDAIPGADAKSVKMLEKIEKEIDLDSKESVGEVMDRIATTQRRRMVNMFLTRGGLWRDEKYARVCSVEFPFVSENDREGRSIFGVKLRVNDFEGFRNLFKFIIGEKDDLTTAFHGATNTLTAPYLTALLMSWFKLSKRLNQLKKIYGKHVPELKDLMADLSWEKELENFAEMSRMIPPLEGNTGSAEREDQNKTQPQRRTVSARMIGQSANPVVETAAPVQVASPAQQAEVLTTPTNTNTVSWAEIQAARNTQAVPVAAPVQVVQQPVSQVVIGADGRQYVMQPVGMPVAQPQVMMQQPQNNWAAASLGMPQQQQPFVQQNRIGERNALPVQQNTWFGGAL